MKNLTLIVGSAPDAEQVQNWNKSAFNNIIAMNNSARLDIGWTQHIHPEDFPKKNRPKATSSDQQTITANDYIPILNRYGGCLYQGATMAFTTAYWALGELKPDVLFFKACDMIYSQEGETHFYGTGAADPLRDDITLQSLKAKSNRLLYFATKQNCLCLNLSKLKNSALTFPRADMDNFTNIPQPTFNENAEAALEAEKKLGYYVESGRYWEQLESFSASEIAKIDALWEAAYSDH